MWIIKHTDINTVLEALVTYFNSSTWCEKAGVETHISRSFQHVGEGVGGFVTNETSEKFPNTSQFQPINTSNSWPNSVRTMFLVVVTLKHK